MLASCTGHWGLTERSPLAVGMQAYRDLLKTRERDAAAPRHNLCRGLQETSCAILPMRQICQVVPASLCQDWKKGIDAEKHFAVSCLAIFRHLRPFKKWLIGWKEQGEFYRELRACA